LRDLDQAKSEVVVLKAEIDQGVRIQVDKVTEPKVAAAVERHPDHIESNNQVRICKHRVDVLKAAVSAIDHRKDALQDLVRLYLANYFAKPQAPSDGREELEDMEKHLTRRRSRVKKADR
jgi:hypothetical protein